MPPLHIPVYLDVVEQQVADPLVNPVHLFQWTGAIKPSNHEPRGFLEVVVVQPI